MHSETHFQRELEKLKESLLHMAALVEKIITDSVQSLVKRDSDLAQKTISGDGPINTLEIEIEETCLKLLALRQPMAVDLRFITMAMKIITDLERMGDQAVNIAERAVSLNQEPQLKPYIDIPKMRSIAQRMTQDALDAFVRKDKRLARDVIIRDDEVDDLKQVVLHELALFMVKDPATVTRAMKISFVATYLERIADHATNIAEMVIYLVDGTIIRHSYKNAGIGGIRMGEI